MKHQRQGVQSTRVREEMEMNVPATPKAKDVYIKVHNATETMHTDQTGRFPATSNKGNIHNGVSRSGRKFLQRRTNEE
jgi:hypothetical protein